ncbi:MAG: hypothetical protein WD032_04205 [Nitrospirales bacterium]
MGATHLLPLAECEEKLYSLAAMAGGVFVALGIILTHVQCENRFQSGHDPDM